MLNLKFIRFVMFCLPFLFCLPNGRTATRLNLVTASNGNALNFGVLSLFYNTFYGGALVTFMILIGFMGKGKAPLICFVALLIR